MPEDKKDENPWKIYDHSYDVPDSRMGKAKMNAKKSLEMLNDLSKASDGTKKGRLGSFKITTAGPVQEGSGKHMEQVLTEQAKERDVGGIKTVSGPKKEGPPPIPSDAKSVNKAMKASYMPRVSRAQMSVYESGSRVLTRGNGRFAKNVHTGPLNAEVIEQVEEDAQRRTTQPIYKACDGCGRRYQLVKGMDDDCPSCSINKSTHCAGCGQHMVKSHGSLSCPICG